MDDDESHILPWWLLVSAIAAWEASSASIEGADTSDEGADTDRAPSAAVVVAVAVGMVVTSR